MSRSDKNSVLFVPVALPYRVPLLFDGMIQLIASSKYAARNKPIIKSRILQDSPESRSRPECYEKASGCALRIEFFGLNFLD